MLRSYSLPTFHHLPLWKNEPFDHEVDEGVNVEINCSAIVGPQYNSIKLQPVRAYWENPKVHLGSKVFFSLQSHFRGGKTYESNFISN